MDDIFNPSLIISLGPSSKRALDFSKRLINHMPEYFLNLIDYYEVQSLETISGELQEIIDTKLLSARNINKLVDLGYKVRSENISTLKVNLYIFWDVYGFELNAYEAVQAISELKFGNIDRNQHSGASLYIIPMMEREWVIDEDRRIETAEELSRIVSFISKEESMLAMDSKVYVLSSVSSDGTRIPMEELEQACGMLAYLNILPSKEPPLAHFNKRPLMNEATYKIGTVGIASLVVFKDKLLEDFSKYLSMDILKHAAGFEGDEDYKDYEFFKLIDYKNQKDMLKQGVNVTPNEDSFGLGNTENFDIAQYPSRFNAWQQYLENQHLYEMKMIIDKNCEENTNALIKKIEEDLRHITVSSSLKETVIYISTLDGLIKRQRPDSKLRTNIDTSILGEELKSRVGRYSGLKAYFYYRFAHKGLNNFMNKCRKQAIKKIEGLIEAYIEKCIEESYRNILSYLAERKQLIHECINNMNKLSVSFAPLPHEEETMGSIVTDLLSFEDRHKFYKDKCPKIEHTYRGFLAELEGLEELGEKTLSVKLREYALKVSKSYINSNFLEYIGFKHKKNLDEELCRWINRGKVKSKYLLQYINNEYVEEHSLFMASPEAYKAVKDICPESISIFEASVIESEDYLSSISIIRLCFGVNIDNITSLKNIKER